MLGIRTRAAEYKAAEEFTGTSPFPIESVEFFTKNWRSCFAQKLVSQSNILIELILDLRSLIELNSLLIISSYTLYVFKFSSGGGNFCLYFGGTDLFSFSTDFCEILMVLRSENRQFLEYKNVHSYEFHQYVFLNWANTGLFFIYFHLFKHTSLYFYTK